MTTRLATPAALAASVFAAFVLTAAPEAAAGALPAFTVHNLVSNQQGQADNFDPDLVNAWGLAHGSNGPLWVVDNGTGVSTVYNHLNGKKFALTVNLPGGAGTGIAFVPQDDDANDFVISKNGVSGESIFLFATETGRIEGWNPNVDPGNAIVALDLASEGRVFKGAATSQLNGRLYVADFTRNRVLMFDNQFRKIRAFTDPDLPRRFAPFNVALLKGRVYVAFAKRERGGDEEVAGPGLGYVDVFSRSGVLEQRLIANGPLNAPWGMTIAPPGFGGLDGALLVGNFGDGKINAFDIATGAPLGPLKGTDGEDIVIDGLWAIDGYPRGVVTFTAGPDDETNGLVGTIAPAGASKSQKLVSKH